MDARDLAQLTKNEHCEKLAHPSITLFVLSCFIVVGILVSYIPQHYKIIHRRSSEGLAPLFILLGTVSGTSSIAAQLVLPSTRKDIGCCKVNDGFSCAAGLLGILQVGIQWSCFFIITFLFLIFIPRSRLVAHGHIHQSHQGITPTNDYWKAAVGVVGVSILHFIVVFIACVTILGAYPSRLNYLSHSLGIFGDVCAALQYIPQIWTTWKRKSVGSLSIPMMCIQTPGSFLFAWSLFARSGVEGWSVWSIFIVTGTLQGVLLVMGIIFHRREAASVVNADDCDETQPTPSSEPNDDEGEDRPLLSNGRDGDQPKQRFGGNLFRGSASLHSASSNVANSIISHFRSTESSRDEEHAAGTEERRNTQYFDAPTRQQTMVGSSASRQEPAISHQSTHRPSSLDGAVSPKTAAATDAEMQEEAAFNSTRQSSTPNKPQGQESPYTQSARRSMTAGPDASAYGISRRQSSEADATSKSGVIDIPRSRGSPVTVRVRSENTSRSRPTTPGRSTSGASSRTTGQAANTERSCRSYVRATADTAAPGARSRTSSNAAGTRPTANDGRRPTSSSQSSSGPTPATTTRPSTSTDAHRALSRQPSGADLRDRGHRTIAIEGTNDSHDSHDPHDPHDHNSGSNANDSDDSGQTLVSSPHDSDEIEQAFGRIRHTMAEMMANLRAVYIP